MNYKKTRGQFMRILLFAILVFAYACGGESEVKEVAVINKDSIENAIREDERNKLEDEKQKAEEERIKLENKRYTHEDIAGEWEVIMKAVKSDCEGTTLGDIRTEKWLINFENDFVVINVIGNTNTNKEYSGTFDGKNIIVSALDKVIEKKLFKDETKILGKTTVNLKVENSSLITGKREVVKNGPCQIEYEVKLKR